MSEEMQLDSVPKTSTYFDDKPLLSQQATNTRSESPIPSIESSTVSSSASTPMEAFQMVPRSVQQLFRKVRNLLLLITFLFIVPFYAVALFLYFFQWGTQHIVEISQIPLTHFVNPYLFILVVSVLYVMVGFKAVHNKDMYWLKLHWYIGLVDLGMQLVFLVGAVVYNMMLLSAAVWALAFYLGPALGIVARIVECFFTRKLYRAMEEEHKAYVAGMIMAEVL